MLAGCGLLRDTSLRRVEPEHLIAIPNEGHRSFCRRENDATLRLQLSLAGVRGITVVAGAPFNGSEPSGELGEARCGRSAPTFNRCWALRTCPKERLAGLPYLRPAVGAAT